jgi:hypothetical protein
MRAPEIRPVRDNYRIDTASKTEIRSFIDRCTNADAASIGDIGPVDAKVALLKAQLKMTNKTCLPGILDMGEFSNLLCEYVNDNPTKRSEGASQLLAEALQQKFPCNYDIRD